MEERLIEFKTAQLAKEKGFKNYRGHTSYRPNGIISNWEGKYDHNGKPETLGFFKSDISAPTQYILQTWLRNKKILVEVRPVDDWSSWCYSIFMEDCMSPFFEVKNNNEYPSYEDALEAGLYEALTNI
jgi:hypothetical protein